MPRTLLLATLALLASSWSTVPAAQGQYSQATLPTLRIAAHTNWFLDPALLAGTYYANRVIVSSVYQGLVDVDEHGRIVKELARAISVSPDRKSYIFTLRKTRFANGDPVTAADIVFSIKRALAPASGSGVGYFDGQGYADIVGADAYGHGATTNLPGVRALSGNRVRIQITRPIASFLAILAAGPNRVVDPRVVRGKPVFSSPDLGYLTSNCPAARATASGQFIFQCSGTGFYPADGPPVITLIPNPLYSGPFQRPHLRLEVVSENSAPTDMLTAYEAGHLDVFPSPAPTAPDSRLLTWPAGLANWLALNLSDPPFNNLHCRLALAYGLDRAALVTAAAHVTYWPVKTSPVRSIAPGAILPGYTGHGDPGPNLVRARSELAVCPDRAAPLLFIYRYEPGAIGIRDAELQVVVEQLRTLGFSNINAAVCASANGCEREVSGPMATSQTSGVVLASEADYADPAEYLSANFLPKSDANIGGFVDPTFDHLVRRADRESDRTERLRLYRQAQHRLLRLAAVVPLVDPVPRWTVRRSVHGIVGSAALGRYPEPIGGDWSRVRVR